MESLNFAGQVHKWQLSQLLQKGTERTQESLLNDLALALRFIIVTARGRLFSHFFSLYEALRALLTGLLRLLGKLINVCIFVHVWRSYAMASLKQVKVQQVCLHWYDLVIQSDDFSMGIIFNETKIICFTVVILFHHPEEASPDGTTSDIFEECASFGY